MDYLRHYNLLVEKAKNRILDSKSETHHIVPRCMGGSNDASNLVDLTPEEHYVAHQMLVKLNPGNLKLLFAANMMTVSNSGQVRNNKQYGWLKRQLAEARTGQPGRKWTDEEKKKRSDEYKGRPGKLHSEESKKKIGKSSLGRTHTLESKDKISKAGSGKIRTEETKNNISHALLGKPKSEEAKKNMRKPKQNYTSKKGIPTGIATTGCFNKGNEPWNKGKEHPCNEDTKLKIKEANSGRKRVYKEDGSWSMIKAGV